MIISVQIVKLSDATELLNFELENRVWFEQHIPPRFDGFYSVSGVKSQIKEFLNLYEDNTMIPMILRTQDGEICGRLNLTMEDSDNNLGVIGYRIGEKFTRKGLATQAIEYMQKYIHDQTQLTRLKAIVLSSNRGSSIALERNGFKVRAHLKEFAMLNGQQMNAYEYIWEKS
ncbi:GNAT family N-acetyltransferase [Vibrio gallaecicus]|uniref:GNAT family N-acetyltransferase n=1 Tax=Vibrio gallaecicus TaxID=552386 RepID=A0ABV4NIM1_9VIBR